MKSENIQVGSFTIQAPYEPGKYEFIAYALHVSYEFDFLTHSTNLFRITIVVE